MIKISPSVLAGDLSCLADEVGRLAAAGADMMHLDVMDGIFVTNLSFGMPVIECLRKHTDAVLDVHLMIDRPERYVERFIAAGADILTFHYEACEDSAATLDLGSFVKNSSKIASEIWSHTLSGCPSVTDSDVNKNLFEVILSFFPFLLINKQTNFATSIVL